ncbi:hypothetical protein B5E84_18560 [Lachnoclostridium sp. An14]|nr:hypothetical protein B5E84_18560 [Lachnoclostridium sp. An14]
MPEMAVSHFRKVVYWRFDKCSIFVFGISNWISPHWFYIFEKQPLFSIIRPDLTRLVFVVS